jgi:hypothetical protein
MQFRQRSSAFPKTMCAFNFHSPRPATTVTVTEHGNEARLELHRTGDAEHHVFHPTSAREEMIPCARRREAACRHPDAHGHPGPLPILIQRTPYGVDGTSKKASFADGRSWRGPVTSTSAQIFAAASSPKDEFVMMRPLADHQRSQSHRRKHRYLRHHRLAAQEHPEQQRPRRSGRHQLSRIPGHDGRHRSSSQR